MAVVARPPTLEARRRAVDAARRVLQTQSPFDWPVESPSDAAESTWNASVTHDDLGSVDVEGSPFDEIGSPFDEIGSPGNESGSARVARIGADSVLYANDHELDEVRSIVAKMESHGVTLSSASVLHGLTRELDPSVTKRLPNVRGRAWTSHELAAILSALELLRKHFSKSTLSPQKIGRVEADPLDGSADDDRVRVERMGGGVLFVDSAESERTGLAHRADVYNGALSALGRPMYAWAVDAYERFARHAIEIHGDDERLSLGLSRTKSGSAEELDAVVRLFVADAERLTKCVWRYNFVYQLMDGTLPHRLGISREQATSPITPMSGGPGRVVSVGSAGEWVYATSPDEEEMARMVGRRIESTFRVTLDSLQVIRTRRCTSEKEAQVKALPWLLSDLIAVEEALTFYVHLLGIKSWSSSSLRKDQRWTIAKVDAKSLPASNVLGVTSQRWRTISIANTPDSQQKRQAITATLTHELSHALVQDDRLQAFIEHTNYWAPDGSTLPESKSREMPPTLYAETSPAEDLCESAMLFFTDRVTLKYLHPRRFAWWKREVSTWNIEKPG